jgi:hypothetical protein
MRVSLSLIGAAALTLAACGEIPAVVIDAAPEPDAPLLPGDVTLRVYDDSTGLPRAGATAVFTHADGTLVGTATSGADGVITFEVDHGDIVHVGWRTGNQDPGMGPVAYEQDLVTVVRLVPGDDIEVNQPKPPPQMALGPVTFFPPGGTVPPGATRFSLRLGCLRRDFPPGMPLVVDVTKACVDGQNQLTALVVALDDGDKLLGYSLRKDVVYTPGLTVMMPAWQTDLTTAQLTVRPPAGSDNMQLGLAHTLRDQIYDDAAVGLSTVMVTEAQASFTYAPGYASGYVVLGLGSMAASGEVGPGQFVLIERGPAADLAAPLTVALANRLPRVARAAYTGGAFRWTLSGPTDSLASAEALRLNASWSGPFGGAEWIVLAPPGTPSPLAFKLYDLVEYLPPATAKVSGSLAFIDVDGLDDGYASFKSDIGTGFADLGQVLFIPGLARYAKLAMLLVGASFQ